MSSLLLHLILAAAIRPVQAQGLPLDIRQRLDTAAAPPSFQSAAVDVARTEAILDLRPTQFSAGMREVDEKAAKLSGMSRKKRERYLSEHPVPVAIGPGGALYILDHHHLALAAWRAGLRELPVTVRADLSDLSGHGFWAEMRGRNWVYLYDERGAGPRDPSELPGDVRGLADDPYRSLAWRVREQGGYRKTEELFAEFRWADFFRRNLRADPSQDFDGATQEALELSRSSLARDLPGYIGS